MSINWGIISDGGVFESLVQALLVAEDPGMLLFGRPGKDAAQDARSADGSVVYQAKFRQNASMDNMIEIAKNELKRITKYRHPSHSNYQHWQNANRWVLIGNFEINPNDPPKWMSQVVPLFAKIGLTAEYWACDELNKRLTEHPEIRDVFFEGENRVLVGLTEAYLKLSAEFEDTGGLDNLFVNREEAMTAIKQFVEASSKRILPIVGVSGIGKSRLLYEAMIRLSDSGWRVFWGLAGSMAMSSKWFRLLNGTQRTVVVIDNPDDPGLVKVLLEQLSVSERSKWRIIIAVQSGNQVTKRLTESSLIETPVELTPLNEQDSRTLLEQTLGKQPTPEWAYSVYQLTGGVPSWLNLVSVLAKARKLDDLPANASQLAERYVDVGLDSLHELTRDHALEFLRWIAIWGTLTVDKDFADTPAAQFLAKRGIQPEQVTRLLELLSKTGLIHRWGVGKRRCAIRQRLVRVQLLSKWLLAAVAGNETLRVSSQGKLLVKQLILGEIPYLNSVLHSLAMLARSNLQETESMVLMQPIFDELKKQAVEGNAQHQDHILDLLEKAGAADPERALEIVACIRKRPGSEVTIHTIFGAHTYDKASLVQRLPWILFELKDYVTNQGVAKRFLHEFFELSNLPETDEGRVGGKRPRDLIKRLIYESSYSELFHAHATTMALTWIDEADKWPFVGWLVECLSNPVRESMGWIASGLVSFRKHAILPGCEEWTVLGQIRECLYSTLLTSTDLNVRFAIWQAFESIHQTLNRATLQRVVSGDHLIAYRKIIERDLNEVNNALRNSPVSMTLEEGTLARQTWKWHLEYGDGAAQETSRECEKFYRSLSSWRLPELFSFGAGSEFEQLTTRISEAFVQANDKSQIAQFFREAHAFLRNDQNGLGMGHGEYVLSVIATATATHFQPGASAPNAITQFALESIQTGFEELPLVKTFCSVVCRRFIKMIKAQGLEVVGSALQPLLHIAPKPATLLQAIYWDPHPQVIGRLTAEELETIFSYEIEFSDEVLFTLMAKFNAVSIESTLKCLEKRLQRIDKPTASSSIETYISALYFAWYQQESHNTTTVRWIFDQVATIGLDARILEDYRLDRLRELTNFKMSVSQLTRMVQSRMTFDQNGPPYPGFQIMPFDFDVGKWCELNAADPAELLAFETLCSVVCSGGYMCTFVVPNYLAKLDVSAVYIREFVEKEIRTVDVAAEKLRLLSYLAAAFEVGTDPWRLVATPICVAVEFLTRDERERIYRSLTSQKTEAYHSQLGKAAQHFYRQLDRHRALLDAEPPSSPLRGYFEWVLQRSERALNEEIERAQEDFDG